MRDEDEVLLSAYHEAAHAVFAHYDDIDVYNVCVSDERGNCVYRADLYERYLPMKYAQFYLAGAYAEGVAADLEHPTPDEVPLSWLIAGAERTPEGDAWYALDALKRVVKVGDVFDSVGEAYAFAMIKLAGLVEKRWYEIEALAFALHDRWVESEEGIGRVASVEWTGMNCPKSSSAYKEKMSMPNTNGHGSKRTILYARVSTDEQARSGYSLPEDDTIDEHSSAADSLEPSRNGRSQGWKQVKDEGRQSPVTLLEYPRSTRSVAEALRSEPRRSERVLEVYSPSILNLVSRLVTPHLHILWADTMSSWVVGADGYS